MEKGQGQYRVWEKGVNALKIQENVVLQCSVILRSFDQFQSSVLMSSFLFGFFKSCFLLFLFIFCLFLSPLPPFFLSFLLPSFFFVLVFLDRVSLGIIGCPLELVLWHRLTSNLVIILLLSQEYRNEKWMQPCPASVIVFESGFHCVAMNGFDFTEVCRF